MPSTNNTNSLGVIKMAEQPDFNELMQKAQEMQTKMQGAQKTIADMTVTGTAGAGLVKITLDGQHFAKKVEIDSSLLRSDDESKEMLEDLVAAAINDASGKIEEAAKKIMSEIAGGIQLPEGFEGAAGQQ
jgi:nucleoid-associated protein EbfC